MMRRLAFAVLAVLCPLSAYAANPLADVRLIHDFANMLGLVDEMATLCEVPAPVKAAVIAASHKGIAFMQAQGFTDTVILAGYAHGRETVRHDLTADKKADACQHASAELFPHYSQTVDASIADVSRHLHLDDK